MGTVVQLICGLLVPSTDYALPALIKIFIAPKRFQHVWLAYNFLSDLEDFFVNCCEGTSAEQKELASPILPLK